jgi:recombinational DNA repair ATPase RecF
MGLTRRADLRAATAGGGRMRITELRVQGFRCFGSDEVRLSFRDLTCLIGPNASGKTSVLMALQRLFGSSRGERQVVPGDFFLAEGECLPRRDTARLQG